MQDRRRQSWVQTREVDWFRRCLTTFVGTRFAVSFHASFHNHIKIQTDSKTRNNQADGPKAVIQTPWQCWLWKWYRHRLRSVTLRRKPPRIFPPASFQLRASISKFPLSRINSLCGLPAKSLMSFTPFTWSSDLPLPPSHQHQALRKHRRTFRKNSARWQKTAAPSFLHTHILPPALRRCTDNKLESISSSRAASIPTRGARWFPAIVWSFRFWLLAMLNALIVFELRRWF